MVVGMNRSLVLSLDTWSSVDQLDVGRFDSGFHGSGVNILQCVATDVRMSDAC